MKERQDVQRQFEFAQASSNCIDSVVHAAGTDQLELADLHKELVFDVGCMVLTRKGLACHHTLTSINTETVHMQD